MRYALVAPYAIVVWDLIVLSEKEFRYIYMDDGHWTMLKCAYIICRYLPPMLWPYLMWCYILDHTLEECGGNVIGVQQAFLMLLVFLLPAPMHTRAEKRRYASYSSPLFFVSWVYNFGYIYRDQVGGWNSRFFSGLEDPAATGSGQQQELVLRTPSSLAGTVLDTVSTALVIQHGIRSLGFDGDLQRLSLFTFMIFVNILSLTSFLGRPKPWEPLCFSVILIIPNVLSCRFILELREARASKIDQDLILQDFSREMRRYFEEDACFEQGEQEDPYSHSPFTPYLFQSSTSSSSFLTLIYHEMASVMASAAQAAHSVATSILAKAQILPGADIPTTADLKENAADESKQLDLSGKNIIIGVPGAFTGTCSAQIPGYIKLYDDFKTKGVKNIYVVSVNDVFVMKAWKDNMAPSGTDVRFIADDKGAFTSALGLLFDATPRLGGPRSKRFVIIADEGKVSTIAVENVPSDLTVTEAKVVLAQL
ncbi:hypothetical protein NP233_g19 [Leucocoprinus birnbaumii]|uniref:Thioredoxin domain-containing protein n=1 Tax=Leucocoprinus birnbaumii TaxID=56174 RepID=A0AAD5W2S8_9AGAR|nr:hypothetical protein NP233_g19 [Leucocoprinus birnbaumii]